MILDQTYEMIKAKHKNQINKLLISDARVGVFLTAVQLSDGSCGVASTGIDSHSHCYKRERDFGIFSPSKIKGQKVIDLFENNRDKKTINSLKAAALNAISSQIISKSDYKILEGIDPIDLVELTPLKTITIVGAFQSYIKKIASTKNKLHVLELDEKALNDDQKQYYIPADEYYKILPDSDIIIITGLTLVNDTIDALLASASPDAEIIVTGPSAGLIPDILFEKNVKIIGAAKITNPGLLLSIVSEAGSGFHLFKYCAEKYCIVNE